MRKGRNSFFKIEGNVYPINHRAFLFTVYKKGDWQFDNLTIHSRANTLNRTSLMYDINDSCSIGLESRFIDDNFDAIGMKIKWDLK